MKIGLDFYKTISAFPKQFAVLSSSLISEGHEVYIISALGKNTDKQTYRNRVIKFLKKNNVFYKELHIVLFKANEEIPQVKLNSCKEHKIDIYFDDRQDVCELLNKNGILACKVGDNNAKNASFFN